MEIEQFAKLIEPLGPTERADVINRFTHGFDKLIGIVFTRCARESVEAYCDINNTHLQPYGLVHGGVYAALSESTCSVGAALMVLPKGQNAVGVANHTSFKNPARNGDRIYIKAVLKASQLGKIHHWETTITGDKGQEYACSVVKIAILEPNKKVGGEKISLNNEIK